MLDEPVPRILVLGGWSPGPLSVLKYHLARSKKCVFIEPNIPMPPMGCSWLCDWSMLVFSITFAFMIWGFISLGVVIQSSAFLLILCRLLLIAMSSVLLRLGVAWIVRRSIERGVQQASCYLPDVDLVIGFSWGGCVVAELLRRAQLKMIMDARVQPPTRAVLIAPTTALVASFARQTDVASLITVHEASQVHVFHGIHDQAFCPHANRWEQTGVTLHWCNDNHVFLRQESIQALLQTVTRLLEDRGF
ncbi:hypothetical protein MHU86_10913 [Fragilaria crotonensis]|nr:hypothetical protein MHU86_10913 [Fragilaria crotonensis]